MSKHVYDNVSYDDEVKREQQVEMVLNVYENTEAIGDHNTNTETGNRNTTRNQQVQPSGTQGVTSVHLYIVDLSKHLPIHILWLIFQ